VKGESIKVYGDLTIRGISKPVVLEDLQQRDRGHAGKDRIGFDASTKINRLDYRVTWNRALEGGGAMLGDEVEINITVEAVKQ
jgi:polyisoprenoid-binding protein YceI